jgi:ADP-ribose pyrophosphatase
MVDYIWKVLGSEVVYTTPYHQVTKDRLLHPLGHELDYYVVRYPRQAVGVVPVDKEGRVLMVQQWRHTVQKLLWEIPAGAMEAGEEVTVAANRELREETGYVAGVIEPLGQYHPTIGSANQTFHVFVARQLKKVAEPEANETHAVQWFSRGEVEGMIDRNELVDGFSLTGVLLWMRRDGK